ncbi:1-aminocyclopropane-1-carboxylate deaminase/D-cysteine desulfhydrase [Xanthovirga aplysinae]|uniref:1-aminocyclopropane-1-carboxylate deaminase/D-cysteine desulfhydrase n=1 Tax=Xanthovirga aplysinae TaxID=2529853 RepID=UPI0012BD3CF8|nr:pyridoxal-phosphate dependent enzyme [Xanthovirga aplysinae]MTI33033.1 1-aminocyclopropane-1-carboxylate deaminase/D-cysteine desulfhydrase [Xanthovirga aplysinae]
MLKEAHQAPTVEIFDPIFEKNQVRLFIKREDLLHPDISGNKWRKLKYNLKEANRRGEKTLLTFGGAYSNHIYAVAAAGKESGFKTIGIIRGEEHLPLNPTLKFAKNCDMELHYLSRGDYRKKHIPKFIEQLHDKFGDFYLIPEGGTNNFAIKGCTEIVDEIPIAFDVICSACGTGGTLAGLIAGLNGEKKVIGFSALKGDFLRGEVEKLLTGYNKKIYKNWTINSDFHFGGYAKVKPELILFIHTFVDKHQIPLDPIYTGKMFYGIYELIKSGYFKEGSRIVALHTGGLQGNEGMKEKLGIGN